MNLDKIQELDTVSAIFEYILENSCYMSATNKNIKMQERETYDYKSYLCNSVINKSDVEDSLDLLIVSNTRNFRNIYMSDDDGENAVAQSRASLYFLFCDYFEGKYDNEIEREFNFRIERDINKFKMLFLKDNVDKFCSFLLMKAQQIERKSLNNRINEYVKSEDGVWKTVSKYLTINEKSWEETIENDNRMSIESFLYKINEIEEEQHEISSFREDNIYTHMSKMLDCLTEKQQIFFYAILEDDSITSYEDWFKTDDDMTRQYKCSYKKNITNRLSKELDESKNVKNTNGYYTLIKSNNKKFIDGLDAQEDNKAKFEWIVNAIKKKNDSRAKLITESLIEQDLFSYFQRYIKEEENFALYRFLLDKRRFDDMIEKIKERLS